jgi:gamma-glutamyl-gamma-aminobutyrate hydrolase PuuD
VQWHPELGWRNDELSQKLFSQFVKACAANRSSIVDSLVATQT